MRGQTRIGLVALAVMLVAGTMSALGRDHAMYSASDVKAAFAQAGLTVQEVAPPSGVVTYESALLPPDGRFTVVVLSSDATADSAFAPYLSRTDPATFEAREGNVIVLADGSNSSQPLPAVVRARLRAALRLLAET